MEPKSWQKGAKMEPKSIPNRFKIEVQFEIAFGCDFRATWWFAGGSPVVPRWFPGGMRAGPWGTIGGIKFNLISIQFQINFDFNFK